MSDQGIAVHYISDLLDRTIFFCCLYNIFTSLEIFLQSEVQWTRLGGHNGTCSRTIGVPLLAALLDGILHNTTDNKRRGIECGT